MHNWRTSVLNKILPYDDPVITLLDPDNLLADQQLVQNLKELQYDIITYLNPVEFRYYYESQYRVKWDTKTHVESKLIVRFLSNERKKIPADLKERVIEISINEIFRPLYAHVLQQVGISEFDRIFQGIDPIAGRQLNETETKKYLLETIYRYPVSHISTRIDLFETLFKVHYNRIAIPEYLVKYCIQNYLSISKDQTVSEILFEYNSFLEFIQDAWAQFLDAHLIGKSPEIPFDNPSLKVYIDTFFLEGILSPIEFPGHQNLPAWMYCGIVIDPAKDSERHLENLLKKIKDNLPQPGWKYDQWLRFAWIWAELNFLSEKVPVQSLERIRADLQSCQQEIGQHFEHWLLKNFPNLQSLSYLPKPVMVHQIPHYISAKKPKKIVLIVFDGLAMDQWLIIRDNIRNSFQMDEESVFAWVPTLTSISRRAIFSGKPPYQHTEPLQDYNCEIKYWEQFWTEYGFKKEEIGYKKGITLSTEVELNELAKLFNKKVIGVVVNTVDDYIKSSNITRDTLNNLVERWIELGYVQKFILKLHQAGFDIFITSDHGNVNCVGTGMLSDGSTSEEKSLRVRIYDNKHLANVGKTKAPDSILWPEEFIGSRYSVLLSQSTSAYYNKGGICISHGGISLEEVIVPFVHLSGGK